MSLVIFINEAVVSGLQGVVNSPAPAGMEQILRDSSCRNCHDCLKNVTCVFC